LLDTTARNSVNPATEDRRLVHHPIVLFLTFGFALDPGSGFGMANIPGA
jgi:hypothetical protein